MAARRVLLAAALAAAVLAAAAPAALAAPRAGGAGHALWFDHQRSDVLGVSWNEDALDAMTVEFWAKVVDNHLKTEAVVAYSEYDASGDSVLDNPDGMQVRFRQDRTCFYRGSCARCDRNNPDCVFLASNDWFHFAVSWDRATGESSFYRNGVYLNTTTTAGSRFQLPLTNQGCFVLGHEPDEFCGLFDESQAFDGLIDEFRVWKRVRTAEEIRDNFKFALDSAADPDLVVYYDFNDPSQEHVPDLSGQQNTGLRGRMPSLKQVMAYSTERGAVVPTKPVFVASSAPITGSLVLARVAAGGQVTIELPSTSVSGDIEVHDISITQLPAGGDGTLHQAVSDAAIPLNGFVDAEPGRTIKRVVFKATGLTAGSAAEFVYRASDGAADVEATVRVEVAEVSAPPARALTFDEDERGLAVLGGVNADGAHLVTVIKTLPSRGRLYQVNFNGQAPGTYSDIPFLPGALEEIVAANTTVDVQRGIVAFVPNENEHSMADEAYATFTYAWRHPDDASLESAPAEVSIVVRSVNDPPVPSTATVGVAAGGGAEVVALAASDPDVNFAPHQFFTVTKFPRAGTLYQVGPDGEPLLDSPVVSGAEPPTVIAWAAEVLNFSTQYESGGTDYHATEALGRPDVYPSSGDSPRAWAFSSADAGPEHLTLRFPNPVFVQGIELYETNVPGAATRVQATFGWAGSVEGSVWSTLWSGEAQAVPDVARVFRPPVCGYGSKTDVVRIEFDSAARSGWNELDAVQLIGTLEPPRGLLYSTSGRVAYVPDEGLQPAAGSSASFDGFEFVASDCEGVSPVPGSISLEISRPDATDAEAAAALSPWKAVAAPAQVGETTLVSFDVAGVVADLRARGVDVSAAQESAATVQLVAVTAAGSFDLASGLKASLVGGEPVTLSRLPQALPVSGGAATLRVTQLLEQGSTTFAAWVSVAGYTYRLTAVTEPQCPLSYFAAIGTAECVLCDRVPDSQIASMTQDERVLFRSRCPERLEVSSGLRYAMTGTATAACVMMLAMLAGVVKYRAHPIIRYSSPVFCALILAGCLFGASSVFVLQDAPSDANCGALPWMLHLSFVLTFASLFAKTYRLAVVFNNEKLRNVKITDTALFAKVVGSSMVAAVVYLSVWASVDPPTVGLASAGNTVWDECQSSTAWSSTPVAVEGFFLVWGVYLCVKTRNNPSAFNESKFIAMAIYNIFVMGAILVPLSMVTNSNPDAPFLLRSAGAVIVTTAVAMLMFVPKFYAIVYNLDDAWDTTNRGGTGTNRRTGSGHKTRNETKDSLQSMADRVPDPANLADLDAHDSLQSMADRMAAADREAAMDKPAPSPANAKGGAQETSVEMSAFGTGVSGPVYDEGPRRASVASVDSGAGAFLGDVASRSHENIAGLEGGGTA